MLVWDFRYLLNYKLNLFPQPKIANLIHFFRLNEQIQSLRIQGSRGKRLKVKRGRGCVKCRYTGYLGRTGLFEVMPITPRIQRLINEQASSQEILREALNDGMLTLREYGIKKIAQGETTYEEVMSLTDERVIY